MIGMTGHGMWDIHRGGLQQRDPQNNLNVK